MEKKQEKNEGESGLVRLTPLLLTWKKRWKREKKNEGHFEPAAPIGPSIPPDSNTPRNKNRHEKLRMSSVTPLMAGALMLLVLLMLLLFTSDPYPSLTPNDPYPSLAPNDPYPSLLAPNARSEPRT